MTPITIIWAMSTLVSAVVTMIFVNGCMRFVTNLKIQPNTPNKIAIGRITITPPRTEVQKNDFSFFNIKSSLVHLLEIRSLFGRSAPRDQQGQRRTAKKQHA
jgi:hypothetical protein